MIVNAHQKKGYATKVYADSLAEFGEVLHLAHSDGYLLKRPIAGTSYFDAIGIYPLFFCTDWSLIQKDLDELPDSIVSVSLVADPFGDFSAELLQESFDTVNPYKHHYIVDLTQDVSDIGTRHHQRAARKALRSIEIDVCRCPGGFSDAWNALYATLRQRYSVKGIRGFSLKAFEQQLNMPEIVVHQAFYENQIIGAQLFFIQDDVVHCHLGAVNDVGYELSAFYALDRFSFEYFSDKALKLDLGGGVGVASNGQDGLSTYKKGWSSELQQVYFCGSIINEKVYRELSRASGHETSAYFPAYRAGEFD